jgi:diacylglycerol kinase (ATP)
MATLIPETDPELKDKIGQLAYGVATLKSTRDAEPIEYQLNIDNKELNISGVALNVSNSGSIGQLAPGIRIDDGLLVVVLLKDSGLLSVIKAAGSCLLGLDTMSPRIGPAGKGRSGCRKNKLI